MAEAVVFVGLQGFGKTTYFAEHFAATHAKARGFTCSLASSIPQCGRQFDGTTIARTKSRPGPAILRMAKRLDAPSLEEGIDELRTIKAETGLTSHCRERLGRILLKTSDRALHQAALDAFNGTSSFPW